MSDYIVQMESIVHPVLRLPSAEKKRKLTPFPRRLSPEKLNKEHTVEY